MAEEKREMLPLYLSKSERKQLEEEIKEMNCGFKLSAYIRYKLFAKVKKEEK